MEKEEVVWILEPSAVQKACHEKKIWSKIIAKNRFLTKHFYHNRLLGLQKSKHVGGMGIFCLIKKIIYKNVLIVNIKETGFSIREENSP